MKYETSKSGSVMYEIDSENRTVKATIACNPSDPQLMFNSQLYKLILGEGDRVVDELGYSPKKFQIARSYAGIAKCHPDDKFDAEVGKRIALLRAKEKYQRAVDNKLFKISWWISELASRAENFRLNHLYSYYETIDDLCDIEEDKRMGLL